MKFDPVIWTFAGLPDVSVDIDEVDPGGGFSLLQPTQGMLGARDHTIMSG
jgi:hypothetical protein